MPSRRELVKMTDEEFWAFIGEQKSVQVATISKDGWPHLTTMWFAFNPNKNGGEIYLESFSKAQKIKNLQRDQRITLLWEDGKEYDKLRGATVSAHVELLDGAKDDATFEEVVEHHCEVIKRNDTHNLSDELIDQTVRGMAAKKTAVIVRPEKTMSWDHTKLGGVY